MNWRDYLHKAQGDDCTSLESRWEPFLASLRSTTSDNYAEYEESFLDYGDDPFLSRDCSARRLTYEVHAAIDTKKTPLRKEEFDVLVIVHPFYPWHPLGEDRVPKQDAAEQSYLRNLATLFNLQGIYTCLFESPERYVSGSSRLLSSGAVQNVLLTAPSSGSTLFKSKTYEELGEQRTIYLAGCYGEDCVLAAAEELWANDNSVVLISDALFCAGAEFIDDLARREIALRKRARVDDLEFVSTSALVAQYSS